MNYCGDVVVVKAYRTYCIDWFIYKVHVFVAVKICEGGSPSHLWITFSIINCLLKDFYAFIIPNRGESSINQAELFPDKECLS